MSVTLVSTAAMPPDGKVTFFLLTVIPVIKERPSEKPTHDEGKPGTYPRR